MCWPLSRQLVSDRSDVSGSRLEVSNESAIKPAAGAAPATVCRHTLRSRRVVRLAIVATETAIAAP